MTRDAILATLRSIQSKYSNEGIEILGLFGSHARGEASDTSDVDVLIELQEGTTHIYEKKAHLKEELESLLHTPVDIVRKKYLKPYAKEIVLNETVYV